MFVSLPQANLGSIYNDLDEHEKALQSYRAAIAAHPSHFVSHLNLAGTLDRQAVGAAAAAAAAAETAAAAAGEGEGKGEGEGAAAAAAAAAAAEAASLLSATHAALGAALSLRPDDANAKVRCSYTTYCTAVPSRCLSHSSTYDSRLTPSTLSLLYSLFFSSPFFLYLAGGSRPPRSS